MRRLAWQGLSWINAHFLQEIVEPDSKRHGASGGQEKTADNYPPYWPWIGAMVDPR
jgi:hypothetical protein